MALRTKGEQKAYLDGYEMCAECIKDYLTEEGRQMLECLLIAVRNAVEIKDIGSQENENKQKVNCKSTKCENCINHNYCDYETKENEKI